MAKVSLIRIQLENWFSMQSPDSEFTLAEIAEKNGFHKINISNAIAKLLAKNIIHISRDRIDASRPYYYCSGPKPAGGKVIPIREQPPLWEVMSAMCGHTQPPEFTYADHFRGINIWSDIVVDIWNARDKGVNQISMPSSLGSSNTIMYSSRRGSIGGD